MRRRRMRLLLAALPMALLAIGGTAYLASNTVETSHAGSTTFHVTCTTTPSASCSTTP